MKILTAEQVRQADNYTIENEPIASSDLMERASNAFVNWFVGYFTTGHPVKVFCGTGNNGGDGLCIARMLHLRGYEVKVFAVRFSDSASDDFQLNEKRLGRHGLELENLYESSPMPPFHSHEVVIDALWGSGLNRPIEGFATHVIEHINKSTTLVVAVDIPSGLYADRPRKGIQVAADFTVSFQLPKLAFFLPENGPVVGEWNVVDIGLSGEFLLRQPASYYTVDDLLVKSLYRPRKKFSHKGTYGHCLVIGGSYGKMGAVAMTAKGALHSGAGLVTTYIPKCGFEIMQQNLPEGICLTGKNDLAIESIEIQGSFDAIGLGPGMGTAKTTVQAVESFIKKQQNPLVIDADGLNILAENKALLGNLPKGSILTPHPKEFERLAGPWGDDFEKLALQKAMAKKYGIIIVLKDAHTSIALPDGKIFFNTTGNPGMATGGSGDVLTGIVTGLLAQKYLPYESAIIGVYLHGLAGDLAAMDMSEEYISALDIINSLGDAFRVAFN